MREKAATTRGDALATYYHVDPTSTRGDASGRFPANHVSYSNLLTPVRWIDTLAWATTGANPFALTKALLREFDKPGALHPRWGSPRSIGVLRECLEMFARGIDGNPWISPIGRMLMKKVYLAHLKNRTAFISFYDENAVFIEQNGKYVAPIIVTGFPRTGTTLLHRLMSEDPRARAPYTFELEQVLPPLNRGADPLADQRIKRSNASMATLSRLAPGFIEKFNESHHWSATEREEAFVYMQFHNGMSTLNNFQAGLEYMLRSVEPDVAPALLKYERNFFTMLDAFAPASSHWINKAPSYAFFFGGLFDEFDDARVVLTHRNPAKNAASIARLMESACLPFDVEGSFDKHRFGRMCTEFWGLTWSRPLAFRKAHPDRERQIIDAVYPEIFADPIATVRKIYNKFELEITEEFAERMDAYVANNKQGKHGRHRYSNAEYAIDVEALKAQNSAYFETFGFSLDPCEHD